MKNKSKIVINLILVIIITCSIIFVLKSMRVYKSNTQFEKEVYELRAKVENQNIKITSLVNENTKLKEKLDIYKEDIAEGNGINEKYEKLLKEKDVLIEGKKQSEYIKLA